MFVFHQVIWSFHRLHVLRPYLKRRAGLALGPLHCVCPLVPSSAVLGGSYLDKNNNKKDDPYSETRRHILTYLDSYTEQCGQHMPHKDAIYLYVHSKKVII